MAKQRIAAAELAATFNRLAGDFRAVRDKECKVANLRAQRLRLIAQAGGLFGQAAPHLPGATALLRKGEDLRARTDGDDAYFRFLWPDMVTWVEARFPGRIAPNSLNQNVDKVAIDSDGRTLGLDGKPICFVKNRDGSIEPSGCAAMETDFYDDEDFAACLRRELTDDAAACEALGDALAAGAADRGDEGPPGDRIIMAVAIRDFSISSRTIRRWVKEGTIRNYRPAGAATNARFILSRAELTPLCPRKK